MYILEVKDFCFKVDDRKNKSFKSFELISKELLNQKVQRHSFVEKTYLLMLRSAWPNFSLSKMPAA